MGIQADFSRPFERAIRALKLIIGCRGKPLAIRGDNGLKCLSAANTDWATAWHIKLEYIQPDKPQQSAYVE